jgi:malonyl-CoA O-methyltransferase
MRAEQRAMMQHWPRVAGARALDLGCGTGRYARLLAADGAADITLLDISVQMLEGAGALRRVRAIMTQLPFAAGVFDVVVSGLAVGHADDLVQWTCEAARVLAPGGTLLYSDFHPDAAAAGMTRSFTDRDGRKHCLSHYRYGVDAHRTAAARARLAVEAVREVRVGADLQETFVGSEAFYRRWHGLAVVLVIRARKP